MDWYHGTPDVRGVRERGGFETRREGRRLVRDAAGLADARAASREPGLSAIESYRKMAELDAFFEHKDIPIPVFLAARRTTAATYADPRRALDYQAAEEAVLTVVSEAKADVTIDAGGASFHDLRWVSVEAGVQAAGTDPQTVRNAFAALDRSTEGRIRVADLGAALWLCGFGVVDVRNVVDTHTGKGRPDTVRMVFEPETLRIPAFAAEPAPGM